MAIEEKINIDTLETLKHAFASADVNRSGDLELEEFKELLKKQLHLPPNREQQIDALFMKIDWASEGSITWDEFCTYMQLDDREIQFFEMSSFEPYCQITGLEDRATETRLQVWDIQDHTCLLTIRPKSHKIRGDLQAVHYSPVSKAIAVATDQMAVLCLRHK
nr:hypothetical protein BaRGS_008731 [Batillaria attramentaria]